MTFCVNGNIFSEPPVVSTASSTFPTFPVNRDASDPAAFQESRYSEHSVHFCSIKTWKMENGEWTGLLPLNDPFTEMFRRLGDSRFLLLYIQASYELLQEFWMREWWKKHPGNSIRHLTSNLDPLGTKQNENTSLMMKLHSLNDVQRVSCAVLLDSCSPMDGYFMTIAALPQCTEVLTLPRTALCLFVWLWENSCNVREGAYPIPRLVFPTGAQLCFPQQSHWLAECTEFSRGNTRLDQFFSSYQISVFTSLCVNVRAWSPTMDRHPIQGVFPMHTHGS